MQLILNELDKVQKSVIKVQKFVIKAQNSVVIVEKFAIRKLGTNRKTGMETERTSIVREI